MRASEYDNNWREEIEKNASDNLVDAIYDFFLLDENSPTMEKVSSLIGEDDILDFITDIEDYMEVEFTHYDVDSMCDGDLENLILKIAKISSAEERAKMKAYYVQNKAQLARKARKRKRRQRLGISRKKSKTGTASGGFSFVLSASSGPSMPTGRSSVGSSHMATGMPSFNPNKRPSLTYQVNHLDRR